MSALSLPNVEIDVLNIFNIVSTVNELPPHTHTVRMGLHNEVKHENILHRFFLLYFSDTTTKLDITVNPVREGQDFVFSKHAHVKISYNMSKDEMAYQFSRQWKS